MFLNINSTKRKVCKRKTKNKNKKQTKKKTYFSPNSNTAIKMPQGKILPIVSPRAIADTRRHFVLSHTLLLWSPKTYTHTHKHTHTHTHTHWHQMTRLPTYIRSCTAEYLQCHRVVSHLQKRFIMRIFELPLVRLTAPDDDLFICTA